MIRCLNDKRAGWEKTVESQGLVFHTADKITYWDEGVYYSLKMKQVDTLEAATNKLHEMCLEAVQHVIDKNRFEELHIPKSAIPLIKYSWDNETPAIYGRFDLAYDGESPPKLLEYNADTPTSLLEAAVIQWYWKEDCFKNLDQFNSIHEKLVAKWKELKDYMMHGPLYCAHLDNWEDAMTAAYMADTASQGGVEVDSILVPDIGWHSLEDVFVDVNEKTIRNIFKLYPWEWLMAEEYAPNIAKTFEDMVWIEPPWKMVLSNKGILPILWEMFPKHENLLLSSTKPLKLDEYVVKPYLSREGQNVTVVKKDIHGNETKLTHQGQYGKEGFIYQELAQLPCYEKRFYPVIGSWVIDGVSAGIGIRESIGPITDNTSRFVPHVIDG